MNFSNSVSTKDLRIGLAMIALRDAFCFEELFRYYCSAGNCIQPYIIMGIWLMTLSRPAVGISPAASLSPGNPWPPAKLPRSSIPPNLPPPMPPIPKLRIISSMASTFGQSQEVHLILRHLAGCFSNATGHSKCMPNIAADLGADNLDLNK
jgi:hypothetical protein